MPVVHADPTPPERRWKRCASEASAWIAGSSPAMTKGKNGRKGFGSETPTDAIGIQPWHRPRPRLGSPRRTSIGVPPRRLAKGTLVVFGSASGQASWDVAGTRFAHPFERALPAPACPNPARIAHPSRSARGLMPKAARARVASPPAGAALVRAVRECLPDRVRTMGENAACN